MKINAKFTNQPVKRPLRPFFGAKRVVDNSGALLCYLRGNKLYDLNHVCFASCKRVGRAEDVDPVDAFVTEGKYLYQRGEIAGKIKRDSFYPILLFLLLLLTVSVISLVVIIRENIPVLKEFTVVDTDGEWNATGDINIFGNKTIKPGDKGTYMFMINNPNASVLKCKIRFKYNYEDSALLPPINYSLISEGQNLELTENKGWFETGNMIINIKSSRSCTIEWEWKFESGDDHKDTLLGISDKKYTITLEVIAEQA